MRTRPFGNVRLILPAIALVAGLSGGKTAAAGTDYSRQGHWQSALALPVSPLDPEDMVSITVNGDVAYLTGALYSRFASAMYAIDCSDSAHPVVTDSLSMLNFDVARSGDFLYVASGNGMNIVSLTDARHPQTVSHLDLEVRAEIIRIHDGLAYVGSNMEGEEASAVVVDVSDPLHPFVLGSFEQQWGLRVLEFSGNIGYMAAKDELHIVDLSDPLRPVSLGVIDQPGGIHDMKVVGSLGIVVRDDAIYLLELEDPARPTRLASIKWPAHAYEQKIHVDDGLLFVSHFWGAVGWDISRPARPVELGEIPIMDGFRGLGLGHGRVYLASGSSGMPLVVSTMDITSRDLVRSEEMVQIPSASPMFDIAGDLLVSVLNSELTVTDIGDAAAAIEVGRVDLSPWSSSYYGNAVLDVDGTLAATYSFGAGERGFRIVDFADPQAPFVRGLIPFDLSVRGDIGLCGSLAITISSVYPWPDDPDPWPNELAVFDLTNPDLPARIGSLALLPGHEELLVAGDLAICRSRGAVTICDLSEPANPRLASVIDGSASGIGLNGHDLYVGRYPGGFQVYDLSDPALPRPTGLFRTLGLTDRFTFDGDIVYASDYLAGCQVIDMSDPGHPAWVGSLLNPIVHDMQVHGDWVHFGTCATPRHVAAAFSHAPAPRAAHATLAASVHPNPFNPTTIVGFELDVRAAVRVTVYDVAGRLLARVIDAVLEPGRHAVDWDGITDGGQAAPAGTYLFVVEAGGERQSVKAVLLK